MIVNIYFFNLLGMEYTHFPLKMIMVFELITSHISFYLYEISNGTLLCTFVMNRTDGAHLNYLHHNLLQRRAIALRMRMIALFTFFNL